MHHIDRVLPKARLHARVPAACHGKAAQRLFKLQQLHHRFLQARPLHARWGKLGKLRENWGKLGKRENQFSLPYMNFPQDVTRDVAHFPQD